MLESPVLIIEVTGPAGSTVADLSSLPGVTVPAWATHAIVRAHCFLSTNNLNANGTDKAYAKVLLNGNVVAQIGPEDGGGNNNTDTSGNDTNDVFAKLDGEELTYSFILHQSPNWSVQDVAGYRLDLLGFLRASEP